MPSASPMSKIADIGQSKAQQTPCQVFCTLSAARSPEVVGPELKETHVLGQILAVVAVLFIGLAAVAILSLLGMRAKFAPTINAMIWFTRTVMNPRQMKSAGTPGAYASVLRCCGRKSGRSE